MRKSIKQLQVTGKSIENILLLLYSICIVFYIFDTSLFYFNDRYNADLSILHLPSKPLFLYIVKWIYAVILIMSIFYLRKKSNFCWIILNVFSFSILLLKIMVWYYFLFYCSNTDKFLLELVAICILITINLKYFITNNNVKIKKGYLLYICLAPLVFTIIIYNILILFQ
ncbi:hypothetical protein M2451_003550 [Dysgonomonas sp. PFB1-18]|nr:hypothetical protein [Dysgonomonas sp. PF1-14]MDH6340534.1 hypothetical protein [Dysgonomonas sp. PF1-16]MDH6382210.1 hypothetical protein [Dysgonomonas sp. PFB1-18]MDH6399553.1 hypothetical protein [Dysgonomonas sp. PF1-23]